MTQTAPAWRIKMLFDGQCPLCSREVAVLRKRNSAGVIAFEDIADPAFDPAPYGLSLDQVVGAMHAVRPDGTIVKGLDVFIEVYEAVGWTWLSRLLRSRPIRPLAEIGYRIFAAVRPKLSRFKSRDCTAGTCSRV